MSVVDKTPKVQNLSSNVIEQKDIVKKNKNLNSVFEKFDKNKDGVLDADEIDTVIETIGKSAENPDSIDIDKTLFTEFKEKFFEAFSKKAFINGKISCSMQGQYGDCWLLAGINSLSDTEQGRKIIKDSITTDDKGNVTVELKGVGKKYTFSQSELLKAYKNGAKGDYDVKAIELAVKEYREELLKENKNNPDKNTHISNAVGEGTKEDPLNVGCLNEGIYILTGKKDNYYYDYNYQIEPSTYVRKFYEYPKDINDKTKDLKDIDSFLNEVSKNQQNYAMTCNLKNEQENKELFSGHVYSVKSITDDTVILINPYNSAKEIKLTKEEFLKSVYSFSATDLSK